MKSMDHAVHTESKLTHYMIPVKNSRDILVPRTGLEL